MGMGCKLGRWMCLCGRKWRCCCPRFAILSQRCWSSGGNCGFECGTPLYILNCLPSQSVNFMIRPTSGFVTSFRSFCCKIFGLFYYPINRLSLFIYPATTFVSIKLSPYLLCYISFRMRYILLYQRVHSKKKRTAGGSIQRRGEQSPGTSQSGTPYSICEREVQAFTTHEHAEELP